MIPIIATSEAAFIVEFEFPTDAKSMLGPTGLSPRILNVLMGKAGGGWVHLLHEKWRDGRVTLIFRESDRAEVVRRFALIGIQVPAK